MSETCPKCRTGRISPITTFNNNWRCELCGYQEYRGNNGASKVKQQIAENERRMAEHSREMDRAIAESRAARKNASRAANAVVQTQRASKQARKEEKKGSVLGTIILIIIVLYVLSKVL